MKWGNHIWYWSGQLPLNRIVTQLQHLCIKKDNTYEHFCSVGGWEDEALTYFELCVKFFSMSSWDEIIWACETHDIMWCLNLVNPLAVNKYSNILNVQLLESDEVACGNALHIRLVRVHYLEYIIQVNQVMLHSMHMIWCLVAAKYAMATHLILCSWTKPHWN